MPSPTSRPPTTRRQIKMIKVTFEDDHTETFAGPGTMVTQTHYPRGSMTLEGSWLTHQISWSEKPADTEEP